jgi:tetratricopeptide (TPR) repeat protein
LKKITIFSFNLIALLFSCNYASDISLNDIYAHRDFQDKRGAENCFDEYEQLLKKNPENPNSYYLLSRCTDDLPKKEELLNIANSKFPKTSIITMGLGNVYWDNQKLDVAYRFFEDAIQQDKNNVLAIVNLYLLIKEVVKRDNQDYVNRFPIFGNVELLRLKQKELLIQLENSSNKNKINVSNSSIEEYIATEKKEVDSAISLIPKKITQSEAQNFMESRCRAINQTLMRTKTTHFNGIKLYMFLSVAENGYVCISTISENVLEIVAADCGPAEIKVEQWNNL